MNTPTVSAVIPTYNRAHLIQESAYSVLNQTREDLELIVVDDGSSDDTEKVVRSMDDKRIVYSINTRRKGAAGARNSGIRLARGKYVALLDSDDLWRPEKLALQIPILEHDPNLVAVYAGWQWVRGESGSVRVVRRPDKDGRIDGLPRWLFNLSQDVVVRRDIAQIVEFDEELPTYLDFDWLIRLSQEGRWGWVSKVLVDCRDHSGPRNSDGGLKRVQVLERIVAKHEMFLRGDPAAWRETNRKLGAGLLSLSGDKRRARHYLARSIRSGSRDIRTLVYGLLASIPWGERVLPVIQGVVSSDS